MHTHHRSWLIRACAGACFVFAFGAAPSGALAQANVLRIVPHANLTILDPVWSAAYITRNHGYMIYDTLFGTAADGSIKPQMVDKWSVSRDKLLWTFTLRDGLDFHDGAPVTSEDVVASLKRWSSRDSFGMTLASAVDGYGTPDAKTFTIKLKSPYGVMLDALGKPSSNVPFIMPARIAATPGTEQIKDFIGSGPFKFVATEFRPGERVVYVKNDKYKPRAEPSSGTAGGKQVFIERTEWVILRDPQTQLNALINGEVDLIEQPAFEQYATLRSTPGIKLVEQLPSGNLYTFRFNHLHAPFNDVRIRRAAMLALGQEQMLKTQVGAPGLYRACRSMFACGTPLADENTGAFTGIANPAAARKLLEEAGYKGEPIVVMRPTDLASVNKLPLVAKQQLEAAGFKVEMPQMDWASLVARRAKRDAPGQGGWNAFMTASGAGDMLNPLTMPMMNATGQKGWFGWQDDQELENLKLRFIASATEAEKKDAARAAQARAFETVSHVPLGMYTNPTAVRSNVTGQVEGSQVYWNIKKN